MRIDLEHRPALDLDTAEGVNEGNIHVRLEGSVDWERVRALAPRVERFDIHFPKFADGRGFSIAARLREDVKFQGEISASGHLIPDQARMLTRVGFDSVAPLLNPEDPAWKKGLTTFSEVYQPSNDRRSTALEKRTLAAKQALVDSLNKRLRGAPADEILREATRLFKGRIATLSSFGAEAGVSLHLVSQVAPDTPVLFLDTERHFDKTLKYRDQLSEHLGLTNIVNILPDADEAAAQDGDNRLWQRDTDACCELRKVRPLDRALKGYDALITGRKRFHSATRMSLPPFELLDGVIRVNPLIDWDRDQVLSYFEEHDIPEHPMKAEGYPSIGCWPCTQPVAEGEDIRAGRWAGSEKTECGIHFSAKSKVA